MRAVPGQVEQLVYALLLALAANGVDTVGHRLEARDVLQKAVEDILKLGEKSMKVYLSARYDRKEEMREFSKGVVALGCEVVSQWLVAEESDKPTEEVLRFMARLDRNDVYRCDVLVRFTDDLSTPTVPAKWCTASRFEETGMAEALGKKIIVVGGNQSLFDRLESRIHVKNNEQLLAVLHLLKGSYENS